MDAILVWMDAILVWMDTVLVVILPLGFLGSGSVGSARSRAAENKSDTTTQTIEAAIG